MTITPNALSGRRSMRSRRRCHLDRPQARRPVMTLQSETAPTSGDPVAPVAPGVTALAHRRRRGRIAVRRLDRGRDPPLPPGQHGGRGLLHRHGAVRLRLRVGTDGSPVNPVHRPTTTLGRGAGDLHGAVRRVGAAGPGRRGGCAGVGLAASPVGPGRLGLDPRQARPAQPDPGVAAEPGVGRPDALRPRRVPTSGSVSPPHRRLPCADNSSTWARTDSTWSAPARAVRP